MEEKKRRPQAIAEILKQCVISSKDSSILSLLDLVQRWSTIAGKKIAEQAAPVRLRHGTLILQVRSSVWAQELQMMTPQLLAVVQKECPHLKIEKLRFVS